MREALEEMQKRVSTNQVDKIAGLAFLMGTYTIPAYYESESLEHAMDSTCECDGHGSIGDRCSSCVLNQEMQAKNGDHRGTRL